MSAFIAFLSSSTLAEVLFTCVVDGLNFKKTYLQFQFQIPIYGDKSLCWLQVQISRCLTTWKKFSSKCCEKFSVLLFLPYKSNFEILWWYYHNIKYQANYPGYKVAFTHVHVHTLDFIMRALTSAQVKFAQMMTWGVYEINTTSQETSNSKN